MRDYSQYLIHEYFTDCYNVQSELEDLCDAWEILISDIELGVQDITENLERIREHLKKLEEEFHNYNKYLFQETIKDSSKEYIGRTSYFAA